MDFQLSEVQEMLRNSVQKFVSDNYELPSRVEQQKKGIGYSEEHWKTFAQLGWLGLPFAEEYGGMGGDAVDLMVMMEEFGKGLVLEPFYPTVVLAGTAINAGASSAQKERLIPGIVAGEIKATVGYAEEQSRYNLADVATSARENGDSYIINGAKSMVANGETANYYIISARTAGDRTDDEGISLFLVSADAEGVNGTHMKTVDGLRASELTFDNVEVSKDDLIGDLNGGLEILKKVATNAILALSAEAVGAMEVLYKDTIDYTAQRIQFDHPLAEFQTVKHRMVEMFTETEITRSMLYRATMEVVDGHEDAEIDVHALKFLVGKNGRFVGQNAVQLHGGMGQTEELRVGHYFIRLTLMDSLFGDTNHHLNHYSAKMPLPEANDEAVQRPFRTAANL